MRLALGLSVHTGWAAAVVAGGDWDDPRVAVRERIDLLGEDERFVFHRAAELSPSAAEKWVARAKCEAMDRATSAMKRLGAGHGLVRCAVVAKKAAMRPLAEIVAAHPRIHTAEGGFFRDVLKDAAEAVGMRTTVIAPAELDAKDPRLVKVGKAVGKPWSADWKIALLGAWRAG